MPTSSHLFYIPLVLLVGLILGALLGRRSVLVQQAEAERRRQLEEARAARRAAKSAAPEALRADPARPGGSDARPGAARPDEGGGDLGG